MTRRTTTRVAGITATSVIIAMFNFGAALPCSCAGPGVSGRQALAEYQAVFVGYATNIIRLPSFDGRHSSFDPVVVIFMVERAWKGVNQDRVTVETAAHSSACGDIFRIGHTYLVYARQKAPGFVLKTDTCTPTKQLSQAGPEVRSLGAPSFSGQMVMKTPNYTMNPTVGVGLGADSVRTLAHRR